jgi:hypothetical protein
MPTPTWRVLGNKTVLIHHVCVMDRPDITPLPDDFLVLEHFPLTVEGNILCADCGMSGLIIKGRWCPEGKTEIHIA